MSRIRKILYKVYSWGWFRAIKPADIEVDIVIPLVEKDLRIFPLCLEGVRRNITHKIKDIYIVAPEDPQIIDFCKKQQLTFINEESVFGYKPSALNLITEDGTNRSGWLFQQFIKLSGKIGTCRYYLCIDADHILIRPHTFMTDKGETVFYMSKEKHQPYYDLIKKMFPEMSLAPLSYVSHKMLFDKDVVEELKDAICKAGDGQDWQSVILSKIDRSTYSGFSEFELYGNFLRKQVKRPWLQKTLKYCKLNTYDSLRRMYIRRYWSLTFPEYLEREKHNNG